MFFSILQRTAVRKRFENSGKRTEIVVPNHFTDHFNRIPTVDQIVLSAVDPVFCEKIAGSHSKNFFKHIIKLCLADVELFLREKSVETSSVM